MKVGDLITTYHKGIWRVIKIERRFYTEIDLKYRTNHNHKVGEEYNPLIHYELVLDSNFNPPKYKARQRNCDSAYCKVISPDWIANQISELSRRIDQLNLIADIQYGPNR